MAVFEVETPNGTFEIDAPDEAALRGVLAKMSPSTQGAAAPATPAKPPSQWELFKAGLSAIAQDPRKALDVGPLKGLQEAVELPGRALEGQLPTYPSDYTPEQMGQVLNAGSFMAPGVPRGLMPQGPGMVRAVAEAVATPPRPAAAAPVVNDALSQAARLGLDIPTFVASDSRATQALGQASRQLPFAGGIVEKAADKFTGDLASKAREISSGLAPGVGDKAAVGNQLRTTIETAAENLTEVGHRSYAGVRNLIEPSRPVREAVEPIQNILSDVMARRIQAGEDPVGTHLKPIAKLMRRPGGPSFAGLQRARSQLGKAIDFDARMGGGMEQGDLKQTYGAVTDAMERAVRGSAKAEPDAAVSALKAANAEFADNLGDMKSLSQALKSRSDEALVNQVIGMAGEKTGNAKRLVQLQQDIGPENMRMLGAHVMDQAAGAGDNWSAARFSTSMDKLSNTAKSVLFGPSRPMVEDLHALASRWAEQEGKFANRSNTGRSALTGAAIGSFASALMAHPFAAIGKIAASAVAGVTLGQVLSRPATARAAVQAAKAAERMSLNPTLSSRNAFFALQRQLTTAIIREFGDRSATEQSRPAAGPMPPM